MRQHLIAILISFCAAQNCLAQTINPTQRSSGVKIEPTGLLDTDSDATYKAFSQVHKGNLGRFDFYYSLEIVPQFKEKFQTCDLNPTFKTYADAFFGTSRAGLTVVKTDIQYRWTAGNPIDFEKNDAALVLAATGTSPEMLSPGNGCFFDETLRPTFPLLQYQGGGQADDFDDFIVKFIVVSGAAQKYNAVSAVTSLFSSVSAIAGWTSLTSGISQNFATLAQSFQNAIQAAGTTQNQLSASYNLKTYGNANQGRIAITIPQMFGGNPSNGNMAIFVRRQASIALMGQSPNITTGTVTDNLSLPNRQCNPAAIAGGNCNSNSDTLRTAIAKLVKPVDPGITDATNPVLTLFDPNSATRQKVIVQMCKALRRVSLLSLHLSTVDEMMVRWAFEQESGLLDQLKTPAKLTALAAANGVQEKVLTDACWNVGDQANFDGMLQHLNKKVIETQ